MLHCIVQSYDSFSLCSCNTASSNYCYICKVWLTTFLLRFKAKSEKKSLKVFAFFAGSNWIALSFFKATFEWFTLPDFIPRDLRAFHSSLEKYSFQFFLKIRFLFLIQLSEEPVLPIENDLCLSSNQFFFVFEKLIPQTNCWSCFGVYPRFRTSLISLTKVNQSFHFQFKYKKLIHFA